jgi:hypothetical protein
MGPEQVGTKEAMMAVQDLEDYDEVVRRFLEFLPPEKRIEGLAPEQVLGSFAPEQRVAGLGTDQLLQVMPDEILRALNDDFIEKLPEPIRTTIRKRRGR